ncbi:uncharacterized protein LOC126409955 [Nymphaea colorata]|uniref:uncharacterized protein LOC126409955 n=1 Tax=Nymphaea colorata TaxID=210225 RepID=UPI00214F5DF5|nr:uncharacterized protein LOC126409955 [Nymphaea colorata]
MAVLLTNELLRKFYLQPSTRCSPLQGNELHVEKESDQTSGNIAMASSAPGARWSHALIRKNVPPVATGIAAMQKHELIGTKRPGMGLLKRQRGRYWTGMPFVGGNQTIGRTKLRLARKHQKLGKLVPDGEFIDRVSLLSETAAYIVALKTQVHVTNNIVNVVELFNEIGEG